MEQGFMEKRIDSKWVANMAGTSATWGAVLWIFGFIFAILGVVADTTGTIGLTMMAWFMLAIVFHLAGVSYWVSWAVGVYFRARS